MKKSASLHDISSAQSVASTIATPTVPPVQSTPVAARRGTDITAFPESGTPRVNENLWLVAAKRIKQYSIQQKLRAAVSCPSLVRYALRSPSSTVPEEQPVSDGDLLEGFTSMSDLMYADSNRFLLSTVEINRGLYGTVYKGRDVKENVEIAVKTLSLDKMTDPMLIALQRGLTIHSKLEHINIIKLHGVLELRFQLHVAMELGYRDLRTELQQHRKLPEARTLVIMRHLLAALAYLGNKNIVHCDVRPEHLILYENDLVKLGSFHMARHVGRDCQVDEQLYNNVGYCAPEILQRKMYNQAVDVWGAAIIFYETLWSFRPFNTRQETLQGSLQFPGRVWGVVSVETKNLLEKMMKIDPNDRLTAQDALNLLACPQINTPS